MEYYELQLQAVAEVGMPIVLSALQHPASRLSRLDLRSCDDGSILSNSLLRALAANTSVTDLGVPIRSASHLTDLIHGTPTFFQRLLILRLTIFTITEEEKNNIELMLAEVLTRPNSCVRFLDLSVSLKSRLVLGRRFWQTLQLNNASNNKNLLQALRLQNVIVHDIGTLQLGGAGGLADYLRSPHCSLLWLDCRDPPPFDESQEWELAESMVHNFSLCTCTMFLTWKNPAAKAKAMSVIRRNSLYKSGNLLQEPLVKPSVAKLFLCGHGEAGKSTLCQALLSPSSMGPAYCGLLRKPISRT
ncbi:hypothetical protein GOP47_0008972 [Adiantum capillus-veneris]|uniref:Uncharacterized protein n=1 Tax=Adiantum capillus-veneris TaxID=13818 RepID=A0A9D4V053_ADICA|nr:hypothetical protein GOP47_0008972 [Adiantum capillus-veneris]